MSACRCIQPGPLSIHDGHCCLALIKDDMVTCEHAPEWRALRDATADEPLFERGG